jgi:hypothetical protein
VGPPQEEELLHDPRAHQPRLVRQVRDVFLKSEACSKGTEHLFLGLRRFAPITGEFLVTASFDKLIKVSRGLLVPHATRS